MSSWAYADRQDLEAWNSKRVLSSHPSPIPLAPWIYIETLPISDRTLSAASALKWSRLPVSLALHSIFRFPLAALRRPSCCFRETSLRRQFHFLSIFFPHYFSFFFLFQIKILLCFYICGLCEKKGDRGGERSLFSSRGENSLVSSRCKAPKQLLSALKLKRLGPPPSTPRALHIILSCNSHCNCRYPDC